MAVIKCLLLISSFLGYFGHKVDYSNTCFNSIEDTCSSKMEVSLPGLPDKLRALSTRLTIDTHIQRDLSVIIDDAVQCADTFSKSFKENSEQLHIQNELVKQAANPKDVNVQSLQNVLTKTKTCFAASRMEILELQTKVHSQIENCREQVKKHVTEQASKKSEVESKQAEIDRNNGAIVQSERDAADLDKAATELSDHANKLNEMANKKKKRGKRWGIAAVAVGVVFAPFTGGASLALGSAAGAIVHGVNEKDAGDCSRRAQSCRDSASDKRRTASNLRDDVKKLGNAIDVLNTEIGQIGKRIDALEDAIRALEEVTSFLTSSIGVSDEVINAIQNLDSTIMDPLLKTQTLALAQRSGNEVIADKQLETLKASLGNIEDVISRNRRFAIES